MRPIAVFLVLVSTIIASSLMGGCRDEGGIFHAAVTTDRTIA